jgi:hypothetical protein
MVLRFLRKISTLLANATQVGPTFCGSKLLSFQNARFEPSFDDASQLGVGVQLLQQRCLVDGVERSFEIGIEDIFRLNDGSPRTFVSWS